MDALRTPDACFEGLADFPFAAHYVDVDDTEGGTLRMGFVDEGPRDGPPVVMIHGNPTWSYMWRKLIPVLVEHGYRAIAIDLIGMGRSDKPSRLQDYSIARHVAWVQQALFERMALQRCHVILHDWGGIIGLRAIADHQDRVASVIMSNTGLPVRDPDEPIGRMSRPGAGMLRAFQLYVRFRRNWQHWKMLRRIVLSAMPEADVAGFAAPCPDKRFLVGNRRFAQMLPTRNDNAMLTDNWDALKKLEQFRAPFLNLFSDRDIVAPDGYKTVRPRIPGTRDVEPVILEGGSHFLLEDVPEAYAREVIAFLSRVDDMGEAAT